jgi:hypothetical protein
MVKERSIMSDFKVIYEEFKVQGKDLVEKLKVLIHEGNIRRIIIKDHSGNTFIEIPVTVAAVNHRGASSRYWRDSH